MPGLFYLFLLLAGGAGGFLSGLLGIGGGIIMFPLLLYAPPLFGFGPLSVKHITGLTMTQGFFAALSAVLFYKRERFVSRDLVLTLGLSLFLSSLAGSLLSRGMGDNSLLLIFGSLAFFASVLMLIPRKYHMDHMTVDEVTFNKPLAVGIGLSTGFLLGMVGQGGAFITIPMMLYVLRIPLRVALGSTLAIGLFSSSAGLAGKIATRQVPFLMTLALLAGAIPMAFAGGVVSKKTNVKVLRWLLALLILASAVKIWSDIIKRGF